MELDREGVDPLNDVDACDDSVLIEFIVRRMVADTKGCRYYNAPL